MKKGLLKKCLLFVAFGMSVQAYAGHLSGYLQFSARMNGANEVPAVSTNALGVSSLILSENRDSLCITINATGLSGAIDGIHIHEGAVGTNGAVVLDLSSFVVGNQVIGVITGAQLTSSLIEKMLNGMLYINLHTMANASGEIRGQIKLETDAGYVANLSGDQQVPAVVTSAYGLGLFNLSLYDSKLDIKVVAQGLSGTIDGAHLHLGAAGTSGAVLADLSSGINGNIITISLDPTAYLADLKAGNVYINLHTAANPNGEIRGQVLLPNTVALDAMLNGAQEVPAVVTSAYGVASLGLSKTFDMLTYDMVIDGLSGTIDGAHIHIGALGANGAVALDLSSGISGNRISGTIAAAALTNDVIHDLLTGNLYINVHTAANPNGEVRGQVYRLAREGYAIHMDGAQEVPAVSTTAYGGGMVSVGRDQMDAHYMVVAGGLSGTLDGAHFHNGAMGTNGAVLFDLSAAFMNNGAYGYLKSTDSNPFNSASSLLFRGEMVYLNIHTAANPNGEIRGQVNRGELCSSVSLAGIEDNEESEIFAIFPNPAQNELTLQFKDASAKTISITDVSGKSVLEVSANQNTKTVDVSSLNAGVYFVNIHGKSTSRSVFMKQ